MIVTYLIYRGSKKETYPEFTKRIFKLLEFYSGNSNINELKVTLTDNAPPTVSVIPFGKEKIAAVRITWKNEPAMPVLASDDGYSGPYIVEEALPVAYSRDWPDGDRTPGVCLLTLFRQRPSISYDTFIDRWHNGHTPLSLKIHPLWHYSRNVVVQNPDDPNARYDGIVEEHCRTREELLNPFRFFGNILTIIPNMFRVYFDVKSFLDYGSVETYLTSEYILYSESDNSRMSTDANTNTAEQLG